jgi:hypothetical protein
MLGVPFGSLALRQSRKRPSPRSQSLSPRRDWDQLDAGEGRRIAERYAAGETMAALAREYKVGEATVWRALRAG